MISKLQISNNSNIIHESVWYLEWKMIYINCCWSSLSVFQKKTGLHESLHLYQSAVFQEQCQFAWSVPVSVSLYFSKNGNLWVNPALVSVYQKERFSVFFIILCIQKEHISLHDLFLYQSLYFRRNIGLFELFLYQSLYFKQIGGLRELLLDQVFLYFRRNGGLCELFLYQSLYFGRNRGLCELSLYISLYISEGMVVCVICSCTWRRSSTLIRSFLMMSLSRGSPTSSSSPHSLSVHLIWVSEMLCHLLIIMSV